MPATTSRYTRAPEGLNCPSPLAARGLARPSPLTLEVTVKRMLPLPLLKPRVMILPHTDASMVARIVAPAEYLTPIDRIEKKRAEEREREEKRKYELSHLWSAPFRHLARGQ
ncbi:unnamed protein product [Parascedosporium putredinis]|uniref:Uncharacterized protein n=1 Tax=Parascedosporium putredinis TaxID=1442378 RepID=A0A9P1H9W0_9PEZI|nr:unnamed protein product [Parascedosporium putredinis]CAI8000810.1 unnamed protein product [Parascedosporium putredinis]